jgi:hypothetical protein
MPMPQAQLALQPLIEEAVPRLEILTSAISVHGYQFFFDLRLIEAATTVNGDTRYVFNLEVRPYRIADEVVYEATNIHPDSLLSLLEQLIGMARTGVMPTFWNDVLIPTL